MFVKALVAAILGLGLWTSAAAAATCDDRLGSLCKLFSGGESSAAPAETSADQGSEVQRPRYRGQRRWTRRYRSHRRYRYVRRSRAAPAVAMFERRATPNRRRAAILAEEATNEAAADWDVAPDSRPSPGRSATRYAPAPAAPEALQPTPQYAREAAAQNASGDASESSPLYTGSAGVRGQAIPMQPTSVPVQRVSPRAVQPADPGLFAPARDPGAAGLLNPPPASPPAPSRAAQSQAAPVVVASAGKDPAVPSTTAPAQVSAPAAPVVAAVKEQRGAERVVAAAAPSEAPFLTPLRAMFLALAGVLTLASAVRLMLG